MILSHSRVCFIVTWIMNTLNSTNRIGFVELFRSYRSQHGDSNLMDLFVGVVNRVGLTSVYLNEMEYYIKRSDVLVDPNYDYYLVGTFNH